MRSCLTHTYLHTWTSSHAHPHRHHAHIHVCHTSCTPSPMHISHMYTSHMHTLTHAHPHTGTTLRLLPPKLVVTEGETVTFTCTPVSPYAYPLLTMNNALVINHPRLKVSKKQYPVEYRIAGNFHEPQTNTPGKNFMIFIFMYGLTTTWTNPRSYSPSHYWYTMIRVNISIAMYVHNPRPSIK